MRSRWVARGLAGERISSARSQDARKPGAVLKPWQDRRAMNREQDAFAPWKEWLRERYARHWYGLGCLVLDVSVVAVILESGPLPPEAWRIALAIASVPVLGFLEVQGFHRFWPPKPPV